MDPLVAALQKQLVCDRQQHSCQRHQHARPAQRQALAHAHTDRYGAAHHRCERPHQQAATLSDYQACR